MINTNFTANYIYRLTGDANAVIEWRVIHDQKKDIPAHNYRGTLNDVLPTLIEYNNNGYGVFCNINKMNGGGQHLSNVEFIRAHVVDMDDTFTAQASYEQAVAAGASFAVQSSPGKYHVYWRIQPYVDNEFFTVTQRKLAQLYNGDKTIIDATRVMRVPGFLHQKGQPALVTFWDLPQVELIRSPQQIHDELAHVNVFETIATRSELGTEDMAAPSLEWLKFAMSLVNPSDMDRSEWLSFSAAIKQAGWNHTSEQELYNIWSGWCAQYDQNDEGENLKLWNSIVDTEVGWKSIERKTPVKAYMSFGHKEPPKPETQVNPAVLPPTQQTEPSADTFGEILSEYECQDYFKDCYFIERTGEIFVKSGRYMKQNQFNGKYGGKQFIISSTGKLTDIPWKAALSSTCWTIPKVDHVRFLPDKETFEIITDSLGRKGLNTYIPAKINAVEGDISIWFDHLNRVLPDQNDQRILTEFMAHCVKYPGFKIPWSPMLQSAPGIGKTAFYMVLEHALGDMYIYSPKAQELVKSGSTFNKWQRGKLLIMVNEIKIDERRELIEILKPMITDSRIEVQAKGVDQEMEDNPANWFFFSNYKDAIPIDKNDRRYSIFYSLLQTEKDILNAGMDSEYFKRLFEWLRNGGLDNIAYWLLNYPIERGQIPVRAPETSSHAEALERSRSPMEVVIHECVQDQIAGFKGGYISTLMVIQKCKASGIRSPNTYTVQTCLEKMGYISLGRAHRAYMQEDHINRTEVYGNSSQLNVEGFAAAQGYE